MLKFHSLLFKTPEVAVLFPKLLAIGENFQNIEPTKDVPLSSLWHIIYPAETFSSSSLNGDNNYSLWELLQSLNDLVHVNI